MRIIAKAIETKLTPATANPQRSVLRKQTKNK